MGRKRKKKERKQSVRKAEERVKQRRIGRELKRKNSETSHENHLSFSSSTPSVDSPSLSKKTDLNSLSLHRGRLSVHSTPPSSSPQASPSTQHSATFSSSGDEEQQRTAANDSHNRRLQALIPATTGLRFQRHYDRKDHLDPLYTAASSGGPLIKVDHYCSRT